MRIVLGLALLVAVVLAILHFFPSRETRLWRFFEATRTAFVEEREEDFLAAFDPAVVYRAQGAAKEGLAEIRRDFRRYHTAGLGSPQVTKQEASLDPEGADLRVDVVLVAGLRPIAQALVRMRLVEEDGRWRVTSVSWQ